MDLFAHPTDGVQRISLRTNHQIHPAGIDIGKVHRSERLVLERVMTNVADYADDLVRETKHRDNTFAQRILIRESCIDDLLTYNDYFVTLPHFLFCEVSAA